MRFSIRTYIGISIVCFLILSAVQFYLVYNTYELNNERYYFSEKNSLKECYDKSTISDKLFPGGQKIIDSFIYRNMQQLEWLYSHNQPGFYTLKQKIVDSIAAGLVKKQSVAHFIQKYKKEKKVKDSLEFSLVLLALDIRFAEKEYIPLYSRHESYPLIRAAFHDKKGLHIAGALKDLNKQNEITAISVSSQLAYSYRCGWALYAQPINRHSTILKQMSLVLALSLLSILIITSLFLLTFRNWLKQKKLSEMKSDFINNVTHELHTPLATITVANRNLQNEKIIEKKENIRPLTEIIQRQADRLSILISQVLDIASADKITLDKKLYTLHGLLDEILYDFELKTSEHNINITFHKGADRDKVMLDRFHFTSIVLNMLDNAIKYNSSSLKTIVVSTQQEESNIQLVFTDNGNGINKQSLQHIFDKFYRSPLSSNGHVVNGLGLGLYYVKKSVLAHHWKIDVKSKQGEGTAFILTIPLQTEEA